MITEKVGACRWLRERIVGGATFRFMRASQVRCEEEAASFRLIQVAITGVTTAFAVD
jgi:hypothetical protein